MSTEAHILAIGKFGKDIEDCLDYPAEYYTDMATDNMVTTELFYCVTRQSSEDLAEMFNIEKWNFNTYYMSNKYVKLDTSFLQMLNDDYESVFNGDLKRYNDLKAAGFDFIYMLSA